MTKIGAGESLTKILYKVSGGLHGVGVSRVNALLNLKATVYREGIWEQEYERGKPHYAVREAGATEKEEPPLHLNPTLKYSSKP